MGTVAPAVADAPALSIPATAPSHPRCSDIAAALRDSASVGLGLVPLGLAFGVVVTHAGLPWWCAVLFTSLIYAGSLEFLLVPLAVAAVPLATVALTAFLVNVRHVFYSLSFPLHRVNGRLAKAYSTFAMTDEAYALTTADNARDWPGRRIVWLQVLLQVYWVLGATVGALLSTLIPSNLNGLDFAMTALFTVLALDALRDRRGDLPTPVLAVLSALIARWLFPGQFLLAAFVLFTAGLTVRRLVADVAARGSADA
ncbi:AzlC family ABC transporter permease [Catenulispora rubra]|uniref:AzlC family ABC transporter permease n=1 Tax=Catenulispora rubra TaxID=280293 RepID=UPI001891F769|nr:AzlC family ABC transporter permease [Catenulispora rubra]